MMMPTIQMKRPLDDLMAEEMSGLLHQMLPTTKRFLHEACVLAMASKSQT